jgi:hypothetical protein
MRYTGAGRQDLAGMRTEQLAYALHAPPREQGIVGRRCPL